jgi:hypothetical protein
MEEYERRLGRRVLASPRGYEGRETPGIRRFAEFLECKLQLRAVVRRTKLVHWQAAMNRDSPTDETAMKLEEELMQDLRTTCDVAAIAVGAFLIEHGWEEDRSKLDEMSSVLHNMWEGFIRPIMGDDLAGMKRNAWNIWKKKHTRTGTRRGRDDEVD